MYSVYCYTWSNEEDNSLQKHYKTWHFHSVYCSCALKKRKKKHFEILGYFSQLIFLQKQKVAEMNLFVYVEAMWAFTCARLTWMFESEKCDWRVGVTALDMS